MADVPTKKLFLLFHFVRSNLALHTAGSLEISIDQSGFSRREKLYSPDVSGKALKSCNFCHGR